HEKAIALLRGTPFGEAQIREFWAAKDWRTTEREEHYLAECAALAERGAIRVFGRWSGAPFDPVYRTMEPVRVLDVAIEPGHEERGVSRAAGARDAAFARRVHREERGLDARLLRGQRASVPVIEGRGEAGGLIGRADEPDIVRSGAPDLEEAAPLEVRDVDRG